MNKLTFQNPKALKWSVYTSLIILWLILGFLMLLPGLKQYAREFAKSYQEGLQQPLRPPHKTRAQQWEMVIHQNPDNMKADSNPNIRPIPIATFEKGADWYHIRATVVDGVEFEPIIMDWDMNAGSRGTLVWKRKLRGIHDTIAKEEHGQWFIHNENGVYVGQVKMDGQTAWDELTIRLVGSK